MLAQPIEVGVESGDQLREAGAEARTRCCLGVIVKKDVVALPQPRWRARALQRSADNGKDALAEPCRLLHLRVADFRACRSRREHENYRVSLADQVAEASLPVLATRDAVAIDDTLKAASIERVIQLVGEVQVVAAVGDEDAKLAPVGRVGSARLLQRSMLSESMSGSLSPPTIHSFPRPTPCKRRLRGLARRRAAFGLTCGLISTGRGYVSSRS